MKVFYLFQYVDDLNKCISVQQRKQQQIPPNMCCFEKFFDIWYSICKEILYVQQTYPSNLIVDDFTHLQLQPQKLVCLFIIFSDLQNLLQGIWVCNLPQNIGGPHKISSRKSLLFKIMLSMLHNFFLRHEFGQFILHTFKNGYEVWKSISVLNKVWLKVSYLSNYWWEFSIVNFYISIYLEWIEIHSIQNCSLELVRKKIKYKNTWNSPIQRELWRKNYYLPYFKRYDHRNKIIKLK